LGTALGIFRSSHCDFGETGVAKVDSTAATAFRTSVVVVFSWVLVALERKPGVFQGLTGAAWIWLTLSGVATGLSWLCYFHALQIGEASRVAPIDKLSVVLVIILAAVFLGEKMTWKLGVGGLLIAVGAVIISLK
jgi:bacterial/archaeal transporter family protein